MKSRALPILVLIIIVAASIAAGFGIFSSTGQGSWELETVRGTNVTIYGHGVYRHMSADVAIQGIGQDYVTLFLAVPALGVAFLLARRGGLRHRSVLAGILSYFFVTYLFYLAMGTYNELFLVYALLLGSSFFALATVLLSVDIKGLPERFSSAIPARFAGGFLIVNSVLIALLWLSIVVPPLLSGDLYPPEVQHYTTLIVQGLDLGLLLPLSFVSGLLLARRRPLGFLLGPVYLVFLSLLMTALCAKIVAMALSGVNVIPAVFIIPTITFVAYATAVRILIALR